MKRRTVDGRTLDIDADDAVVAEHFDLDTYQLHRYPVTDGWRVLDLGANVGVITVDVATRGASVVAVEPHPANVERLRRNIAANDVADRVQVIEAAVARPGFGGWFVVGECASGGRLADDNVHGQPVDTVSVAALLALGPFSLIKLDIEGAEHDTIPEIIASPEMTNGQIERLVAEWHGTGQGVAATPNRFGEIFEGLASLGHVSAMGRPDVGGLIWWRRYDVDVPLAGEPV